MHVEEILETAEVHDQQWWILYLRSGQVEFINAIFCTHLLDLSSGSEFTTDMFNFWTVLWTWLNQSLSWRRKEKVPGAGGGEKKAKKEEEEE
jgi:hypothetical protein